MKYAYLALACGLIAGLSLAPAEATAQTLVQRQLVSASNILEASGYTEVYERRYGSLGEGRKRSLPYRLLAGWDYKIVAMCDGDCGDIDLCIYDEQGRQVDCDVQSDDKPIVEVMPRSTGLYTVEVDMHDCDVAPCGYGVAVFAE